MCVLAKKPVAFTNKSNIVLILYRCRKLQFSHAESCHYTKRIHVSFLDVLGMDLNALKGV